MSSGSDEIAAVELAVLRGDAPVAKVTVAETERERVAAALAGAGYVVEAAEPHPEGEYDLSEECSEDRPRPCELTVALGMAQLLAEQGGVPAPEVLALEAKGRATDAEALDAVRAVVRRLPSDMQPQGQELLCVAFGECAHG